MKNLLKFNLFAALMLSVPAFAVDGMAVIDMRTAVLSTQAAADAFKALEEDADYASNLEEAQSLQAERQAIADPGGLVLGVDLEDLVHLRQSEHHCVLLGQRPPGQRRPRRARHHRHFVVVAVSEHRSNLRRVFGQHHEHGHGAIAGETIGLIAFQLVR